jgi:nucleotide-binding universal stress UspA family protein
MPIRDILVCLDASKAGEARQRLALLLARRHRTTLTALYVLPEPPVAVSPVGLGPVPAATAAWTEPPAASGPPRDPEQAEVAEVLFRSELREAGLDGEWYLLDAHDLAGLLECANAADLTILGQVSPDEPGESGAFPPDRVVIEVGRPVLIVPYAGRFETIGRRVLVAWDGSREAARALGDALPLLAEAEAVTLVYIGAGEKALERARPGLDRVVRHLGRHGIAAHAEETPGGDVPIADLLLSRAADLAADLVVAGAYHHSPLREALLGGVSRELLRTMTVPTLMAH